MALGARRDAGIGTVTLAAAAATASFDAVDLGSIARIRTTAELGVAAASGSPGPAAAGRTAAVPHAALAAGIAPTVPLGTAWAFEGFVGGGYALSLTAQVDGASSVGLGGWFATAALGVRCADVF